MSVNINDSSDTFYIGNFRSDIYHINSHEPRILPHNRMGALCGSFPRIHRVQVGMRGNRSEQAEHNTIFQHYEYHC